MLLELPDRGVRPPQEVGARGIVEESLRRRRQARDGGKVALRQDRSPCDDALAAALSVASAASGAPGRAWRSARQAGATREPRDRPALRASTARGRRSAR